MKENIEKKIETFIYGILSFVFGAAFFFGVLYPSQGLSPNAYRIKEPAKKYEAAIPGRSFDKDDIQCTLYFYERFKKR